MDASDVAIVAVALGIGIVGAFVAWTYIGPMIAGTTHAAQPAA
jgi:hypothetical protein